MANSLAWCVGSTVLVFLSNAATFFILCGIGLSIRRGFGPREAAGPHWFLAFWTGFAATIWFLMLWNFLFPVGTTAFALVLASGLLGIYQARAEVARLISRARSEHAALLWTLLLAGLWLANLSTGPLLYWDSVQYHLRAIKWAHEQAAVPGLANLYGPLGYNNASFLYDALLMATPWGRFAHHIASSSLIFPMLAQCLVGFFALRNSDRPSPGSLLAAFLLPAVVVLMRKDVVASFATDVPTTLVLLAAACAMYDYIGRSQPDSSEAGHLVVTITALLAIGVCIKFGTAVFAACSSLLVFAWHLHTVDTSRRRWRPVIVSVVLAAAIGLTWMTRGIVLSGYPMFPMPIGGAPVEWRAPVEHARAEQAFIVHASRVSAAGLGTIPDLERFATWFPRWLPRLVNEEPFAVLVPGVLAALGFILYMRVPARISEADNITSGWLVLIPVVAGVVAWFSVAPEPRYAVHLFWTLAAVSCAQGLRRAGSPAAVRQLGATMQAVLILVALGAAVVMSILERPDQNPFRAAVAGNLSLTPIGADTTAPWTPSLQKFVTRSGLVLSVPLNTGGRCGDAPLLCTPNPAPNLRQRDPRTLARGFAVDGAWQMQVWPYDWLPRFLASWRALQ